MLQDCLGDGTWNLNRFKGRGDMPGITKEQPEKIKATYGPRRGGRQREPAPSRGPAGSNAPPRAT